MQTPENSEPENPGTETSEDTPPRKIRPTRSRNQSSKRERVGSASRAAAQGDLGNVEKRLKEMLAGVALAQQTFGMFDPRHAQGALVTAQFTDPMVKSWIALARENPNVKAVLIKLSQSSAWGEVILVSTGFIYSTGQAYQVVPTNLPNPWITIVPASDDVTEHSAQATESSESVPGSDAAEAAREAAKELAEKQRKEAENRRKSQPRPGP